MALQQAVQALCDAVVGLEVFSWARSARVNGGRRGGRRTLVARGDVEIGAEGVVNQLVLLAAGRHNVVDF